MARRSKTWPARTGRSSASGGSTLRPRSATAIGSAWAVSSWSSGSPVPPPTPGRRARPPGAGASDPGGYRSGRKTGKAQRDGGAATGIVRSGDGAAVGLDDPPADAQAEAVPARLPRPRAIDAEEGLEHVAEIGLGNAGPVVDHAHDQGAVLAGGGQLDRPAVRPRVLDRVPEQVAQ